MAPVKVPFSEPSPTSEKPKFVEPSTEEEKAKYERVLAHFSDPELKLPVQEKKGSDVREPLLSEEKAWVTRECILRYIRATNWDVEECIKRLENSIAWRRGFGIAGGKYESLRAEDIATENETGKQLIFGFDKGARPCLILASGKQNTKASFKQTQNLIFYLERAIDFMPQGQDKLALCVDFKSYPDICTIKGFNMPSVSVGKEVLHVLQYHYPERLGRALFINIPWYARAFLNICYPFVDPYTKQKVAFDKPFSDYIPNEQLAKNYGGDVDFKYDFKEYWPEFIRIATEKRTRYMKRFEELGGTVGLSEYDLRA